MRRWSWVGDAAVLISFAFFVAAAACTVTCCSRPPPAPELPPGGVDGGDACGAMCANLARHDCPEAAGTPEETCWQACERLGEENRFPVRPACVAAARGVDAIRACGTVRCRR